MRTRAYVAGLALGAVGSVVWLAAPAGAQDPVYPPSNPCGIQLSASAVRADQTFTVTGTQGEPGIDVTLTFESEPVVIATATTDAQGAFQVEAAIPAGAAPGVHTVRVQGHTSCAAQVRVVDTATPPPGGGSRSSGLAYTGANPLVLVLVALVVLTVGFVLVAGERRHRARRATIRRERRARRAQHSLGEEREEREEREPTPIG
jgi:hypothetical protein